MINDRLALARTRHTRSGTATVELAVCLPTILLLILGSIECCSMIFLQQSLKICSYEGARTAIRFDSTNSEVTDCCNEMITYRHIYGATVTITPSDVASVPRGEIITVEVRAACGDNTFVPRALFSNRTLVGKCTMVKE